MLPLSTVAASFVPSAEEVISSHFFVAPTEVQFAPLLLEVHMLPPYTLAASFVPSAEEVIPRQFFFAPVFVTSVQFAAADPWSALSSKTKQTDKRVFMACMVRR
jgi:hypothetical protein